VSTCFELADEPLGLACGVAALVVVAAEFSVELAGGEHVPAGADDRVFDGPERFLVAAAGFQARVLRGEVRVLAANCCEGGFLKRPVEPFGALAGLAGAAFAGGWSLPGHWPAQEARCLSVGNTDMSTPISGTMTSAARR
jgi:hypothetical protein